MSPCKNTKHAHSACAFFHDQQESCAFFTNYCMHRFQANRLNSIIDKCKNIALTYNSKNVRKKVTIAAILWLLAYRHIHLSMAIDSPGWRHGNGKRRLHKGPEKMQSLLTTIAKTAFLR